MRGWLRTVRSEHEFEYKQETEILFELGPKKRECFYFVEACCPEYVKRLTTVKETRKAGSVRRIETKDAVYELRIKC